MYKLWPGIEMRFSVPKDTREIPPPDAETAGVAIAHAPYPHQPSLRRNFGWTFAGNMISSGSQWVTLTLLSKLGTATMVGQFALGLAVSAPIFQFANLQLRAVLVTDARNAHRFGEYFGVRIVTSLIGLLLAGTVAVIGYRSPGTGTVILLVAAAKWIDSLSDIFQGLFQRHEQMDRVAKSMIFKGVLSTAAVGAAMVLYGNIIGAMVAIFVVWLGVFVTYDVRMAIRLQAGLSQTIRPVFRPGVFGRLVALTLPLGFVMLLISLNSNLPRYFLERQWGEREVGIYSALAYCMVASNTIISALGQSASPRLANYYAGRDMHSFWRLLRRLLVLGAALGIAGIVVAAVGGRPLLSLLYRPEYGEHSRAFVVLMSGGAVLNVSGTLGVGLTSMQVFKPQVWVLAFATVAGILASWFLVPGLGVLGAAIACLVIAIASASAFALLLAKAV
jgi:O-antigen/teichoic acid export membrane protein